MDIRVAAYALIIEGDRILLAHWNERGRSGWTLPGGGIDPGEDPAAAAVREIFEETGFRAELDGLVGIDSIVTPAERRLDPEVTVPLHSIRVIYRAHITGGELTYEQDGSTDWAAWHSLSKINSLGTVSLVPAALRLLRDAENDPR